MTLVTVITASRIQDNQFALNASLIRVAAKTTTTTTAAAATTTTTTKKKITNCVSFSAFVTRLASSQMIKLKAARPQK